MNDVDDLDDLERELGPSLRVALRRAAAEITDNGSTPPPWATDDPVSPPDQDATTMVDLETMTWAKSARVHRPRRLVVAVILSAAAAVVVIAVAGVALSRRDRAQPADQSVGVAESFMDAWVRGDGDAVAALITPDTFFDAWTAETLPDLHDWYRAMGWHYEDEGCEIIASQRVSCDYTAENDLTRAFGRGPVPGSFVLVIDGGTVTSVSDDFNFGAYKDIWDAFIDWVRAHHPDDVDRMYTFAASHALVDPTAIGLWAHHIGEFVESGDAYIARSRAICLAVHERYDGLVAASTGSVAADSEAAAGVLEQAVVELRSLAPPEALQAQYEFGYGFLEQLVESLRQLAAAGPVTTTDAQPSRAAEDLNATLTAIYHVGLGLGPCGFNPLR